MVPGVTDGTTPGRIARINHTVRIQNRLTVWTGTHNWIVWGNVQFVILLQRCVQTAHRDDVAVSVASGRGKHVPGETDPVDVFISLEVHGQKRGRGGRRQTDKHWLQLIVCLAERGKITTSIFFSFFKRVFLLFLLELSSFVTNERRRASRRKRQISTDSK